MSSNFWLESDDEWDDDIYSSESGSEQGEVKPTSRFADIDMDDDEEDSKRVTRSAHEKSWDELNKSIKVIKNKMFINDWNTVSSEWETLKKSILKSEPVFAKEGIPRFLTSFLLELEDRINEMFADKAFKKSASPTNAKSLNSMKQGFKKWLIANPNQSARVEAFRANPKLAEEVDEAPQAAKKAAAKASAAVDQKDLNKPKLVGRERWLKRADDDSSSSESDDDDDDTSWLNDGDSDDDESDGDVPTGKSTNALAASGSSLASNATSASNAASTTTTSGDSAKPAEPKEKAEEWTPEKIDAKLKELVARRGTRNYDRIKQVGLFAYLIEKTKEKANTPERLLKIMFALVDAQFDVNQNMYSHMNVKIWKYTYNTIVKIFDMIAANVGKVVVIEGEPEILAPGAQPTGPVQVRGLLLSQLERLDEEYFKSLQFMDPHTQDYVVRMRHEPALLKLLKLGFDYFEARGETQKAANLAARRLDHLYYRRETEAASQRAALREAQRQLASEMQDAQMARDQQKNDDALRDSSDSAATSSTAAAGEQDGQVTDSNPLNEIPDDELTPPQGIPEETNLVDLVPQLCALVYKSNEERLRIRAVLQHIYHLALHDKYFEARDRMLATRMQDEISNASDITMHIAFNRALVQLGLAAFRKGRIADAHHALAEIMGPRVKELLAQGVVTSKFVDRTLEQEKLERRRQMPYPMHINIDLVEFVHLTSAMLLEVPNMAANVHDQRKRIISKTFRKTLENTERQTFTGPPENTRDHVIAAAKSLIQSDWNQCSQYLLNLDIWKLIPKADDVKAMLKRKIQEEALRTHLFTNAQFYETIKLDELVSMFGLPQNSVHAIVSKMMIHDELLASWDQPSAAIIMNGQTPTHLQHLSLQYAERISALFDNTDSDSNRGFNRGGNWDGDRNQSRRQGGQGGQQGGQEGQGGFRSGGQGQQSGDRSQGAPRKDGDHHGGRKYDGKRQDGQKSRIGAKSSGNSGGKKRSHHN